MRSVRIDRVIAHAGAAKATLYNAFGTKDGLVRAYLQARHAATAEHHASDGLVLRFGEPSVVAAQGVIARPVSCSSRACSARRSTGAGPASAVGASRLSGWLRNSVGG
ncbi:hypothetical protein GCM10010207_18370 [Streptomyces atratus]|nr:hypothetical protein GCM10010207_18370 [Streptomyces atratus]